MTGVISGFEAKARDKDQKHREQLDAEVERRKAQEHNPAKGENVWFSRRIHDGHLHHWAMFVYGKKYELRLPTREKYKDMLPKGQLVGSAVPSFKYEARIVPWSLRDEVMQIRDASIDEEGKPHALDYYICQIGWTRLSEEEVDFQCKAVGSSFGLYVLGFNDCQTFLKQFAKMIIEEPEGCALDYHWFADNIETPYHKLQEIAPDENIKAFQLHLQIAMFGAIVATTGAVVVTVYEPEKPMQAVPQRRPDQAGNGAGASGASGPSQSTAPRGGQQNVSTSGKGTKDDADDGDCCDGGCCCGC